MTTAKSLPSPRTAMPKPSDAITALIEGLRATDNNPDWEVDMHTFGRRSPDSDVCYGCAATYTVFHALRDTEVYGDFETVHDWADNGVNAWHDFEKLIDYLRYGDRQYQRLLDYYDIGPTVSLVPDEPLPRIFNGTWQEQLPAYEKYRDQLRSLGH